MEEIQIDHQLNHQYGKYTGNEHKYVMQFLDNTKEPWTYRLEKAFAEKFGVKYAVAHNSCTSALHTALAACSVGVWDEVISPGLTVIMDAFATMYTGARPVFADIDPDTFNIDPTDIQRKITKFTRAIVVVHLYGLPADMEPIMEIAKEHHLWVIEDSAQCVLATYKGKLAGTIGHIGCFSFERSKHLAIGEGGMLVTNWAGVAERARKFAGIGYKNLTAEQGRMQVVPATFQDPSYKRHDTLGYNYRMPEISAAVGLAQLERAELIVSGRELVAQLFAGAIEGCPWMIPQKTPEGYTNTYYTYAVKYEGQAALGVSWRAFYNKYIEMGGDGFYACYSVPYQEPALKTMFIDGNCPVAEATQPKLMQFKTNYRDMELAKRKAEALRKTIKALEA